MFFMTIYHTLLYVHSKHPQRGLSAPSITYDEHE